MKTVTGILWSTLFLTFLSILLALSMLIGRLLPKMVSTGSLSILFQRLKAYTSYYYQAKATEASTTLFCEDAALTLLTGASPTSTVTLILIPTDTVTPNSTWTVLGLAVDARHG
jgi:hypothetical protein